MGSWSLKKLIIAFAFFGAGFAFLLLLVGGVFFWYQSRPKPPPIWNQSAIVATYSEVNTTEDNKYIVFFYTLENKSKFDYIIKGDRIVIMARLLKEESLSGDLNNESLEIYFPVFLPSKNRTRFGIKLKYPIEEQLDKKWKWNKYRVDKEGRKQFAKYLEEFVNKEFSNLNGFVIFDEMNRYQINFPKGW